MTVKNDIMERFGLDNETEVCLANEIYKTTSTNVVRICLIGDYEFPESDLIQTINECPDLEELYLSDWAVFNYTRAVNLALHKGITVYPASDTAEGIHEIEE